LKKRARVEVAEGKGRPFVSPMLVRSVSLRFRAANFKKRYKSSAEAARNGEELGVKGEGGYCGAGNRRGAGHKGTVLSWEKTAQLF